MTVLHYTHEHYAGLGKTDRPRKKLHAKGAASLLDFELLEAFICSGNTEADLFNIVRD